ncbi:hypothetical protein KA005_43985 [bacterium]|nr:hypothetical protein [bacterium]
MAFKSKLSKINTPKALKEIERLISQGMSENAVASHFGLHRDTFSKHKKENIEIQEAIARGHHKSIKEVVNSLLKAAKGYFKTDTKIIKVRDKDTGEWVEIKQETTKKWFKPSEKAIIYFLENKDPENWSSSEKAAIELIVNNGVKELTAKQLEEKLLHLVKKK